jgi:rSAM/selenodomain-associated transferase 1
MKRGLIVFAREPLPGTVKTRLASSVGNQAATELYETMLDDVLETARQLSDVDTVVYWACEDTSLSPLSTRYRCHSRVQSQGNLGKRMQAAFIDMMASGCDVCCIIGSDAPDLPIAYIEDAYRILETLQADVVLGPCPDGGYYLLGMRQVWDQLFVNIAWSTSDVLGQSLAAAQDSGLSAALLPEWRDIDTVEDLQAYQERRRVAPSREPL